MIKELPKLLSKFILLFGVALVMALYLSRVLRPDRLDTDNDTKSKILEFYELKNNSLDALLLGSSHMYYGISPGLLYENTTLNSYIRGGECQPIEVSYYLLKEAFQYQKPKLVILDVFGLSDSVNTCKTDGIYRVNLENLKTSKIKIEAYSDIFKNESLLFNIFDVSLYKERWHDISVNDFFDIENGHLGTFGYTYGSNFSDIRVKIELNDFENVEIDKTKLEYLERIYDICKDNNSKLLLIKTPYYISDIDAGIYSTLEKWAEGKEVDFINFNNILEEINYEFDIDGDIWHSNVKGSLKLTNYLSNYINGNYKINAKSDIYNALYHDQVVKLKQLIYPHEYNLENLIKYTKEKDQILLMNYNYFPNSLITSDDISILEDVGYDFKNHSKDKMIIMVKDNEVVEEYYNEDYFSKKFIINNQEYLVESNGYVSKNGEGVNIANNYACISIIDEKTGELIDTYCLDTEGSLYVHRDKLEN